MQIVNEMKSKKRGVAYYSFFFIRCYMIPFCFDGAKVGRIYEKEPHFRAQSTHSPENMAQNLSFCNR